MDEITNLARVQQLLESVEKDLTAAKELISGMMGNIPEAGANSDKTHAEKAKTLNISDGGKIIEGVFDGQNMVGPDGRIYPVPANYASKSKLVEGDVLKLTIAPDGSFVYKQIGPVERKRILGILVQDEKGDYKVVAEGKTYKVLLASLTYYKAEPGDQVTLMVPEDEEASWAAVENVIKEEEAGGGPQFRPEEREMGPDDAELNTEDEQEERQVRILADDDDF